jgi:hypothetical protein
MNEEKAPAVDQLTLDLAEPVSEYVDPVTRLKQARALKKEVKKSIKSITAKLNGDQKLAKVLVKGAIKRITKRHNAGRGR